MAIYKEKSEYTLRDVVRLLKPFDEDNRKLILIDEDDRDKWVTIPVTSSLLNEEMLNREVSSIWPASSELLEVWLVRR